MKSTTSFPEFAIRWPAFPNVKSIRIMEFSFQPSCLAEYNG